MKIGRELSYSEMWLIQGKIGSFSQIHFIKKFDFGRAKKILGALCGKYALLSSKVIVLNDRYYFSSFEKFDIPVRCLFNLSRAQLDKLIENELNVEVGCDQALIRFSLFTLTDDPTSFGGLLINASHVAMDVSAHISFVNEFLIRYFEEKNVTPKNHVLIPDPIEHFFPLPSASQKDDMIRHMMLHREYLDHAKKNDDLKNYRVHFAAIQLKQTVLKQVIDICKKHDMKMHGYFMSHITSVLARFYHLDSNEISCVSTMDYRRHLEKKDREKLQIANASGGYRGFYKTALLSNLIHFSKNINDDLQEAILNGAAISQFLLKKTIWNQVGVIPTFCILANLGCIDAFHHNDQIGYFTAMTVNLRRPIPFFTISTLNEQINITLVKYGENEPKELRDLYTILNELDFTRTHYE